MSESPDWEIKVGGEYRSVNGIDVRRVTAIYDGRVFYNLPALSGSSVYILPPRVFRNLCIPPDESPIPALIAALQFVQSRCTMPADVTERVDAALAKAGVQTQTAVTA